VERLQPLDLERAIGLLQVRDQPCERGHLAQVFEVPGQRLAGVPQNGLHTGEVVIEVRRVTEGPRGIQRAI
jgi:hypothetical protein